MLKGKRYDAEETFKAIIGFPPSSEESDEKSGDQKPATKSDSKPRKAAEPEVKSSHVQPLQDTASLGYAKPKKRPKGRPKMSRETKKRFSFTTFPSVYEKAAIKADKEGLSLSQVISSYLEGYTKD